MPVRVLVTGRGSIAQRHVRHLRALADELELSVVSATGEVVDVFQPCQVFCNFEEAMNWKPDAVIVASVSSRHAQELEQCLVRGLPCLAEKPLVTSVSQLERLQVLQKAAVTLPAVVVGCNLRYLPALQKLKSALATFGALRVLRAQFEVGQELSQWRQGRDLQASYSAREELGGGVVFDLVHEIDMARWLLGDLKLSSSVGGQKGAVPITSDDVHVSLLQTDDGAPVVISLDYLSQQTVRRYAIVTTIGTFEVNLMGKKIELHQRDGTRIIADDPMDFDVGDTYRMQMMDWLAAMDDPVYEVVSSLSQAVETSRLMLAMKVGTS